MKKIGLILFCVCFFCVCTFFSLGMLIPGASGATEGGEGAPSLLVTEQDGSLSLNHAFGTQFETWFSKNFAYRNQMVDFFSSVKADVLKTGNDQVIVGKEDFLFFAETADNYLGNRTVSDAEIESIADSIANLHAYATSRGAEFLFVCAPNKNTVYPQYMPSYYIKSSDDSEMDLLYRALDRRGVPYLDLRPVLQSASESELVYHKRDTHWNGRGAEIAYRAMMEALDRTPLDFSAFGPHTVSDFCGDLDTLLYPSSVKYDQNTVYDLSKQYIYTSAYTNEMNMRITTRSGGKGKLLCFRDSFANAMLGYLAADFQSAVFERGMPYGITELEQTPFDCVIVEIAQRNIKDLLHCDANIVS